RVNAESSPHRRQAPKALSTGEAVATVYPLGLRRRVQDRQVVAALAVPGCEDLAPGTLFEHPLQRGVTQAVEVSRQAHPVQVHVRRQGGGWRAVREAALLAADLGQRHAVPTECARDRQLQVAGLLQLLEILREEAVLAVVGRRALATAGDQFVRQCGRG